MISRNAKAIMAVIAPALAMLVMQGWITESDSQLMLAIATPVVTGILTWVVPNA